MRCLAYTLIFGVIMNYVKRLMAAVMLSIASICQIARAEFEIPAQIAFLATAYATGIVLLNHQLQSTIAEQQETRRTQAETIACQLVTIETARGQLQQQFMEGTLDLESLQECTTWLEERKLAVLQARR